MGSDYLHILVARIRAISIHAPRMGSDRSFGRAGHPQQNFNPRSPHGERLANRQQKKQFQIFQSTLPAWGATYILRTSANHPPYFNPRSPHGERPPSTYVRDSTPNFNPRSPHGERPKGSDLTKPGFQFQSTLPAWGATKRIVYGNNPILFQSTLPAWGAT